MGYRIKIARITKALYIIGIFLWYRISFKGKISRSIMKYLRIG